MSSTPNLCIAVMSIIPFLTIRFVVLYNADAGESPHLHRALFEDEILKENKDDANDEVHQRCYQNFRPRDFVALVDFLFTLEVAPVVHPVHPLCVGLMELTAKVSFIVIILTYQSGKSSGNLIFVEKISLSVCPRSVDLWKPLRASVLLCRDRL